ncbi:MAG: hemerythrin domain-containing protein [Caldilineaceae bacterium]|nr:hemerythrin domain-containing protein [Caldilineaceae bacterium]
MMYVQLGATPEHDFDQPLGLLSDCHRRIEHFLGVLLKVAREAPDDQLSEPYGRALEVALTYFREAAPKHTQDEEESLFPRLRRAGCQHQALNLLEADHQEAETMHFMVEGLATLWLADGQLEVAQRALLVATLSKLERLYAEHIQLEDTGLFPLAAALLEADQLADIGREMARRRGL